MHARRSACSRPLAYAGIASALTMGCANFPDAAPQTNVVLENRYPADSAVIVYAAVWQNASFVGEPLSPGASSKPQGTVPASADNTAYALLALGWDSTSESPPQAFIAVQSRGGFAVALGDTLTIPVDDDTFEGDCAAGSHLTQEQANFLTQIVFGADFVGVTYDAATCMTTPIGDAGGR